MDFIIKKLYVKLTEPDSEWCYFYSGPHSYETAVKILQIVMDPLNYTYLCNAFEYSWIFFEVFDRR